MPPAAVRERLLARLFAVFERQLRRVERQSVAAPPAEADVKLVAALARTLDLLVALDGAGRRADGRDGGDGRGDDGAEEIDIDAVRERVARRLAALDAG